MSMHWQQLLSSVRFGEELQERVPDVSLRTEFQRDYDRLIFSSAFRRMESKTQVFPLPGSVFVHNRLTHSLEVAAIGRSLGNLVADRLLQQGSNADAPSLSEIGTIVSAACLAHDMGNPPFGHSGEKAISSFFTQGKGIELLEKYNFTQQQWSDLQDFEGNANLLRLITHQFCGKSRGGFLLTYSTIAATIKYPFGSLLKNSHKKKYGYFDTEKETFFAVMKHLGIPQKDDESFCRHPLVYLMEAADDISYLMMDLEDAHKLHIFTTTEVKELLLRFHAGDNSAKIERRVNNMLDPNEQISLLRAKTINKLVLSCADIFVENQQQILKGELTHPLVHYLPDTLKSALSDLRKVSYQQIYLHRKVLEMELSGFNILNTLVETFIGALDDTSKYADNLKALVPSQFDIYSESPYTRIRSMLDYISGMTDLFALEKYKVIKGISLPLLR